MSKPSVVMEIRLKLLEAGNGWAVIAPNKHRQTCRHTASLAPTVEAVVANYADWLKETTSLAHLEMTCEHKTVAEARRAREKDKS